ncbi:hypothetical protein N7492_004535 [Penicillium capsulatum]|uniref:Uncharacterized protein n=1 Tax=Penicillium capsulatum TaxID=69766 RepID=A0A9W9LQA8_9EURO|nr:hypothetical protein N7492_004535 [Penicillium capsulatum]KAJ6136347.1 hypothetical protein N7512_001507 [Penicillium capsulatum]
MESTLQNRIDEIRRLDLSGAIEAIAKLTSDLSTSVSHTGIYLAHHPAYEGPGNLNDLGTFYLHCAERCRTEHAAFEVRLHHVALEDTFSKIYDEADTQFKEGRENGTIVPEQQYKGCGCCSGRPDAVIGCRFHEGNALYFDESEYRQLWGSQKSAGSIFEWSEETQSNQRIGVMASKAQVEEAMARVSDYAATSRL